MVSNSLVKVNIGSGPYGKPDWINLDWGVLPLLSKISWITFLLIKMHLLPKSYHKSWPSNPRLWDCRRKLPFKDKSVDFIYCSHFIEHLFRYQAEILLKEFRRIIRPSGVVRICVPDIKLLAEKYISGDRDFFSKIRCEDDKQQFESLADQFVQHFYGYDLWSEPNLMKKIQRIFIRGHFWMYDYDSLRNLLRNAGFSCTYCCKPGKGKVPDIDYLDIHKTGSLFVETLF